MNQVHLHLVANHIPVVGSIIGIFILLYGWYFKSERTVKAALWVLLVAALGAVVTYITGEGAEEAVENMAGVSESVIEEHEEAAIASLVTMIVLGSLSLVSLLNFFKSQSITRLLNSALLVVALASFGTTANVAWLGGKIRHTELGTTTVGGQEQPGSNESEEGDD